jgi:transcriptional regulator with XRE-family HTH domain
MDIIENRVPSEHLEHRESKGDSMYPNIKLQMWRSGMRQNRLARMVNVDETTLSRIVNGFRRPGPEVRAKIAVALKRDQGWLFEEIERNSWDLDQREPR